MGCRWKAWTTAKTPEKAVRVGRQLTAALGNDDAALHVEPYPKTHGHVISFEVEVPAKSWSNAVVALIAAAQTVGRGWQLLGNIEEGLELLTNTASVGGVSMMSCELPREGRR